MELLKRKIALILIFFITLAAGTYYFWANKPRITRYNKARLVYENTLISRNGRV